MEEINNHFIINNDCIHQDLSDERSQSQNDLFSEFSDSLRRNFPFLDYLNNNAFFPNNETNENAGRLDFVGTDTFFDESISLSFPQRIETENPFLEHRNNNEDFLNSETNENIGQIDFMNTNTISDEATLRPRPFPEINQRENNSNENNPLTLFSV